MNVCGHNVWLSPNSVNEPEVLLDEPLSALDLKLRTDMQYELRELQRLGNSIYLRNA